MNLQLFKLLVPYYPFFRFPNSPDSFALILTFLDIAEKEISF